jgi:hypothetical protein
MDDDELALVSNRCSNHDPRPAMTIIQGDIARQAVAWRHVSSGVTARKANLRHDSST